MQTRVSSLGRPQAIAIVANQVILDPTNWDDRELPSSVWTKADNRWQAFAAKWREHNGPVYKVVDGARIIDLSDIRYLVQATLTPLILVRTCYDDAVIATLGTAPVARRSGMIFTGQPGIGQCSTSVSFPIRIPLTTPQARLLFSFTSLLCCCSASRLSCSP